MPLPTCLACATKRAEVKRPQTGQLLCKNCFFKQIEDQVHETIISEKMFSPGEIVVSGASGGKDSTVLLHLLTLLNVRHSYNLDIRLLSIDEGIRGYREDSIRTVMDNATTYQLPLHILSYSDLFGWTMDEVVEQVGVRNSCTYCGVLRRQALERGAVQIGATVIATGHNADDNAETILMNILRADIPRLLQPTGVLINHVNSNNNVIRAGGKRKGKEEESSTSSGTSPPYHDVAAAEEPSLLIDPTHSISHSLSSCSSVAGGGSILLPPPALRRVKPLKHLYQKDIVLYARHKNLLYFSTECTYAHEAFRGTVRNLLKRLEVLYPQCIAQIAHSGNMLPMATRPPPSLARTSSYSRTSPQDHPQQEKSDKEKEVDDMKRKSRDGGDGTGDCNSSVKGERGTPGTRKVVMKENDVGGVVLRACFSCGAATTQQRCRACVLLASLEHPQHHSHHSTNTNSDNNTTRSDLMPISAGKRLRSNTNNHHSNTSDPSSPS